MVHSFGRADRLDRAALERLVRSIRRVLDADPGTTPADTKDLEGRDNRRQQAADPSARQQASGDARGATRR